MHTLHISIWSQNIAHYSCCKPKLRMNLTSRSSCGQRSNRLPCCQGLRIHIQSFKSTYSFVAGAWQRVPLHSTREYLNPWRTPATRHCVLRSCSLVPAYKEHSARHCVRVLSGFFSEWGNADSFHRSHILWSFFSSINRHIGHIWSFF